MVNQDKKEKKHFEDIDKLAKRYRIEKLGYIATGYIKEQEEAVYMAASKILASKYSDLISINDIYEKLKSKGHIFTIYKYSGDRRTGLYDSKTDNVLVSYIIKRMSENLLHELTHKAGFVNADESFFNMNYDVRENGTEIVASSSFSSKYSKNAVLPYIWGRYPENTSSELLVYSLVNQLNLLVGGNTLEKSILNGHDYFKETIENKYGSEFCEYVFSQISLITKKKNTLYANFKEFGLENEKNIKAASDFFEEIQFFEDTILRKELDFRLRSIDSLKDSKHFLVQLSNFGKNRLQKENDNSVLEDENFEKIFNEYKEKLEQIYGETGIVLQRPKIEELPILEIEDDLDSGEIEVIEQMAIQFEKTSRKRLKDKKRSKISKAFKKIFGGSDDENEPPRLPEYKSKFDNTWLLSDFNPVLNNNNIQKDYNEKLERE